MLFKDRAEAGKKLADLLKKNFSSPKKREKLIVVSLLRGGIVVGAELSIGLQIPHLPLAVAKIAPPYNPELAIGSLCFDSIYLNYDLIKTLDLDSKTINEQIKLAKEKFFSYIKRFNLSRSLYKRKMKNKEVIIVDDGIATGSTLKACLFFIKICGAKKIYLASPVAPTDFQPSGFNQAFILSYEPFFSAVSRFYESFPQIEDIQIKAFFPKLFRKKKNDRYRSSEE